VRTGFRSNNVDHCTRLCHASSVVALLEGIGSGAVSNPVMDVAKAEVVIVIGANPSVNHPVASSWIKNAANNGTKLIVCDPRRSELARHAHRFLQFKPDTDVALLNAMMHVIVEEDLVDASFIASRTIGYDELRANVANYSPEAMAPICGIDAETIRYVARLYATSRASMILWGMGISQHVHGTDNARCLIALSLMTGQIGRPARAASAARPEQRAGRVRRGPHPDDVPDYQHVSSAAVRSRFESAWGLPAGTLDERVGLTVVEVMNAIKAGTVRGMYIMGENPAMSDPDANHARESLAALELLVVQDIFFTETGVPGRRDPAGERVPREDRHRSPTPTGSCRWAARRSIPLATRARTCGSSRRSPSAWGLPWREDPVSVVFDEMRKTMPSIAGITWERLEREHAGHLSVHEGRRPGPVGRLRRLVPA
jgi:formate dehydrogenase major subunit